jgi:phosphoribosylformylglycinamidine (FGAM) synthase-like amidotransferase family enzyme
MRPTIGLFHKHPHASAHCCVGMLKALSESFRVELLDVQECTYRRMRSMQIVAFPGGVGEADAWSQIFHDVVGDVRLYVQKGGGYLGVCMGAYWAGPGYFDLIPGLQIDQYIKAPGTEIRRSYMTTAKVDWLGQSEEMFFWDGPVMNEVGEVVARYKNGRVMATRVGNVGLIGCHPESEETWYAKKYMRNKWHGGKHWELLRDFVAKCIR